MSARDLYARKVAGLEIRYRLAARLMRRYKEQRDEARHEVFLREQTDDATVVALEGQMRQRDDEITRLRAELAQAHEETERYAQEARDSAREAGRLRRERDEARAALGAVLASGEATA